MTKIFPQLDIPETLAAGPGPGNTDPRVLERFAKTGVADHMQKDVLRGMLEAKEMLRELWGTKNVYTYGVAGTGFSYPSGHVLAAAATWAFLPPVVALYSRRRDLYLAAMGVAGALVLAVAWSRVWLGVHWTSDVVASLLLSFAALNGIEAWLARKRPEAAGDRRQRAIAED